MIKLLDLKQSKQTSLHKPSGVHNSGAYDVQKKKMFKQLLCVCVLFGVFVMRNESPCRYVLADNPVSVEVFFEEQEAQEQVVIPFQKSRKKSNPVTITKKERDSYLGKSGFIGSSIGVGQKMYFDSKGKGFLGNPVMLVRGCYSFYNDQTSNTPYMIHYKGTAMKAKDAVKKSGIKRVFICMGTNDMYRTASATFEAYKDYIKGIQKKNPKVVIFIEAMPPVRRSTSSGSGLNNHNINLLNQKLAAYCKKQKDMYYIDINSVLKDKDGRLKASYCSDNYCHITFEGYAVWTNVLCDYVEQLLRDEKRAEKAVKQAGKTRLKEDIDYAKKCVGQLDNSTVKDRLKKKLKKIKEKQEN